MDLFDDARNLYRDAKLLLDETRDRAARSVELRVAREELEEDLLDLKLAVLEGRAYELPELIFDAEWTCSTIAELVERLDREDEGTSP